jgi:hypothetical protein
MRSVASGPMSARSVTAPRARVTHNRSASVPHLAAMKGLLFVSSPLTKVVFSSVLNQPAKTAASVPGARGQ